MKRINLYRLCVILLSCVIVVQWIFIFILSSRPKEQIRKQAVKPAVKGLIAVVIDDWGYNLNNLDIVKQIKQPFSAAVLPNISYSQKIAEELNSLGIEIILHLPMEPYDKQGLEQDTIMVAQKAQEIKAVMEKDLDGIIYARGISNHMGSRVSEDKGTMETILKELKERNLFFLDSLVTADSVGFPLARSLGVPCAKRDVFLDNRENLTYIKQQLDKLKSIARAKGQAVGIGHDRRVTLEVLKEEMPKLEKQGYKFVYISELAR